MRTLHISEYSGQARDDILFCIRKLGSLGGILRWH